MWGREAVLPNRGDSPPVCSCASVPTRPTPPLSGSGVICGTSLLNLSPTTVSIRCKPSLRFSNQCCSRCTALGGQRDRSGRYGCLTGVVTRCGTRRRSGLLTHPHRKRVDRRGLDGVNGKRGYFHDPAAV